MIHLLRSPRAVLAAALLALALALGGRAPAYAACGGVTFVSTEAELDAAIADFNGQAAPCNYDITFAASITLTGNLTAVQNEDSLNSLTIDGRGATLDGDFNDGLEVRPGSPGCDYDLLISTVAGGAVRNGTNPPISFTGEDVLRFCLTSVGAATAGSWALLEELQSEGLGRNNSLDIAADETGDTIYFLPKTTFTLDGATVRPSEIAAFDRGARTFSGPLWKAKDHGLMQTVDGIDVVGDLP